MILKRSPYLLEIYVEIVIDGIMSEVWLKIRRVEEQIKPINH